MRKLFVLPLIAAFFAFAPAAVAVYDDTSCATTTVAWANDPCAGNQWGVVNVQAPHAWSTTRGAGVTAAVVDTGADFSHPDLAANLVRAAGSDMTKTRPTSARS